VSASTEATITAFNEAFGRHDVDAVMALMTDDCIFENTLPTPDGERLVGASAVRAFWNQFARPNSTSIRSVPSETAFTVVAIRTWPGRGPGAGT
jgi:ketosteroid isomerase-like protein